MTTPAPYTPGPSLTRPREQADHHTHRGPALTTSPNPPDTCVFCDIVAGRAPATLIRAWDDAIALVPIEPYTTGHVLVIPRVHVPHLAADPEVTGAVMRRAAQLARDAMTSANILTSWGSQATQTVPHLHVHVVPRVAGDESELGLWPWPRWAQLRHTYHAADPTGRPLCLAAHGTASARWADATCPDCIHLTTTHHT
ncbi:MAG TPA: HIT domain-containing protein [Actinocrinis sp.]|nr:HIT domain-containing protein [Actinocrinis sp.]